jgi:hypothetical protein
VIDAPGEGLLREVRDPYQGRLHELLSKPATHLPHLDASLVASALEEVVALVKP